VILHLSNLADLIISPRSIVIFVQGFPSFHVAIDFAKSIGLLGGAFKGIALVSQSSGHQIRHKF